MSTLVPSISAQVNINSKTSTEDSNFYELGETEDTLITNEAFPGTPVPTGIQPTDPADEFTSEDINQTLSPINQFVTDTVDAIEGSILSSQVVPDLLKQIIEALGLPTSAAVGFSLPFLFALFTLLPLILSPQLFFLMLGALFGQQKNVWGIVMDDKTKEPIAFAVIRLFEADSTSQVAQKVSDLEGRYGFVLSEGKYRLEVSQAGYTTYKDNVVIKAETDLFAKDIKMKKGSYKTLRKAISNILANLRSVVLKYALPLSILGWISSVISLLVENNFINSLLFFLYTLILLLYVFIKLRKRRKWGIVVDSESDLKLAGATIRLFDPKNSLSDTQLTDSKGRFGFFVDPGHYTLLVAAAGFRFPSPKQKGLKVSLENSNLLELDVDKTGILNLELFLDPDPTSTGDVSVDGSAPATASSGGDNLLSPFSG
ncbi:MAG: carboxypeptidase-like regulatory domain-containing protein [Candidatus Dojkabacteria bacterium]